MTDTKSYTTEAMVGQLEAIKADRNLSTGAYKRRYKLTRGQSNIQSCFGLNETDIDERYESMSE